MPDLVQTIDAFLAAWNAIRSRSSGRPLSHPFNRSLLAVDRRSNKSSPTVPSRAEGRRNVQLILGHYTSSLSDFRRKSFVFNDSPFQVETVNTVI